MQIHELMSRHLVTVEPRATVAQARELMATHAIRHLPVMDGAHLVGVVSDLDVHTDHDGEPIAGVMSAPVVTLPPTTTVRDAARLMRRRHISCVPVELDGQLMGIVTAADLLDVLSRRSEAPSSAVQVWLWWLLATVVGSVAAMAVIAVYGVIVASNAFLALAIGGALEASVLGAVQWIALKRLLAPVPWRPWLAACGAGGLAGWSAGMLVGRAGPIVAGAVIGGVLGTAQWLVLRRHGRRAGSWIVATALAWIPGLAIMVVGEQMEHGFWAGIATAALVGGATGLSLVRMGRPS